MAGRDYLTPRLREVRIDDPRLLHHHRGLYQPSTSTSTSSRSHHPGSVLLEDRIAIQHREIQSLLDENQRLASTHVALKHDLRDAQLELRHVSAKAADVKAESDAQARDFYQRSLEMEAEVRVIDAMSAELAQVRADVQKLFSSRQELAAQLQAIEDDLARARSESHEVPPIKSEIESLRREIQRGRAAIENEKKTRASNLEHRRAMERYISSMAHELVKLQAELASAEKRTADAAAAAAAAAPTVANPSTGYAASYGNPDMAYGGNSYPDPYGMNQVQVQGVADAGPQFGSGAMPYGTYDTQQSTNTCT